MSNGYITKYIVYAIPLGGTTRQRRQAVAVTTPQTIRSVCNYYHHREDFIIYSVHLCVCVCVCVQEFPGTARVGNVTLTDHSITYQFQVSAAVGNGETFNEGDLSIITASSTVFVPEPGKTSVLMLM